MGEMNENAVQPQLESVVEQPNNQLGEQQIEAIVPSQEATGAVVEEPKPIVEQQIALDVNVEDVFAGGTTKEDEITQIVTDAVKNAEESLIEEPIPTVIQPPVVETPVAEVPLPEVPAVEIPVSEPIAETAITEVPVQTEEAPAPAVQVPTPEVPVVEQPVVEVPVPEVPAVEVPVTESVPTESVVTLEPGPVIEEQNPMAELAVPQPEPIPDPVSDFAQSINNPEVNLFAQNPSGLTIENIQATMQQQELSQNGESFVGIPAELTNQSDVPTPVTDEIIPVGSEPPKVEESENEETKTIIHQSAPLGKVQPVAPISVYTEQTGSILPPEETADESDNTTTEQTEAEETPESVVEVTETSEDTEESVPEVNVEEEQPEEAQEDEQREETQNEDNSEEREKVISPIVTDEESDDTENSEEQTDEEEQPEETTDDDSDDKDKKSINIKDLDDIAIKILEEETKEVEVSTKQKHKVNIEDELYVEIDEAEAPKQSRNNKRKMIKGREKFKSNQKIVPLEEEPIIRFCKSCGNVVSKEKVVCENCGEPV